MQQNLLKSYQVNTKKGKYLLSRTDYVEQFLKLVDNEIPIHQGKTLTETYNKICR